MNRFTVFLICIFFSGLLFAQTDVTSDITANTTWTTANSPYRIGFGTNPDNIRITNGAQLTIQAGVTVLLDEDARLTVGVNASHTGRLTAVGTASNYITFTRSTAGVRHWGIRFTAHTGDNSELSYCIIEYGLADGSFPDDHGGGIFLTDCSPTIQNSIIRYCRANRNGGAMYIASSEENNNFPNILNNHIYQDSSGADGGYFGGGIAIAAQSDTITPYIKGNLIENCYAPGGGGGIWLDTGSGRMKVLLKVI